jgi:hypothetical protein
MVNCFAFCNPESNPGPEPFAAAKCVQGAANDDCVTECGRGELGNQNVTFVPLDAVTLAGWKTKLFWNATSMLTLPGVSGGAVGAVETDAAGAEAELEVGAGAGEVDEESPPP